MSGVRQLAKVLAVLCVLAVAVLYVAFSFGPFFPLKNAAMPEEERELEELLQVLKTRLENYSGRVSNLTRQTCKPSSGADACFDTSCPRQFSTSLKERLRQVLSVRTVIPARYLQALTSAARAVTSHKYILVTGASSNHFNEMQALLHSVFTTLLPHFEGEDYGLVIYNLGLTAEEKKLTEQNCRCTVVDFPFSDLPDYVSELQCYIWKPLIVQSLLEKAEYLAWIDASIRFRRKDPILKLFQRAKDRGYLARTNSGSIAVRTRPSTAAFFGDHLSQYAPFSEMETNFIIFYNDRFTREAIMKPWLSCAFNRSCMCMPDYSKYIWCRARHQYGVCHRWEQSTIGMIFSKLYLGHRPMLTISQQDILIRRDTKMNWFKQERSSSSSSSTNTSSQSLFSGSAAPHNGM